MKFSAMFFALAPVFAAFVSASPSPSQRSSGNSYSFGGSNSSICIDTAAFTGELQIPGVSSLINNLNKVFKSEVVPALTSLVTVGSSCPSNCAPAINESAVASILSDVPIFGANIAALVANLPLNAVQICSDVTAHREKF